jgi:integrase
MTGRDSATWRSPRSMRSWPRRTVRPSKAVGIMQSCCSSTTPERASEAAAVAVRDLDARSDGSGSVRLVGKGGKTRHCPLWPTTMTSLRHLTSGRSPDEPVFRNRRRLPITRFVVHAIVTRYIAQAGIACLRSPRRRSAHVIRHYAGSRTKPSDGRFEFGVGPKLHLETGHAPPDHSA